MSAENKPADNKPAADDDVDLFGEDTAADAAWEAEVSRRAAEAQKKLDAKNAEKGVVMKSSVLIDIKPWDDSTDLEAMERAVREIEMPGLVWGAAKQEEIAFGMKKLQILCTVEDDKVSVEDLCEKIQELEDYVQSTDIAAFNKV